MDFRNLKHGFYSPELWLIVADPPYATDSLKSVMLVGGPATRNTACHHSNKDTAAQEIVTLRNDLLFPDLALLSGNKSMSITFRPKRPKT